ncbi:type II secretion system F family protein [Saccharopolyspora sp. SCSIO 74807]|uniref:type II secretion system F family protein n=1 Tax=Saccharopolyspora sp. SCSIO 74807 TaxID=3118084 RepID=UPI0030D03B9D
MSPDLLTAGACGLALAVAILLVLAGRTGVPQRRATSPRTWSHRGLRLGTAGLLLGAGAWWATGWPVAMLIVAAAAVGLPRVLAPSAATEAIARAEALATWTRRLGDLLASGAGGLSQAITRSAATAPEPLTTPVQRLAHRLRTHGTETALRAFADDLADPAVDAVVLALLLRLRAGGRGLADLLHHHADAQAREITARRQVEADRAKPRTTVRCLIGITLVMLAGLVAFAGHYLAPFATAAGQGALAVIALLAAGAITWMHRLTTPPPAQRYLITRRRETA